MYGRYFGGRLIIKSRGITVALILHADMRRAEEHHQTFSVYLLFDVGASHSFSDQDKYSCR